MYGKLFHLKKTLFYASHILVFAENISKFILRITATGDLPHFFKIKLVLSGPGQLNSHGLFLVPCRHRYVYTYFFLSDKKHFSIYPFR